MKRIMLMILYVMGIVFVYAEPAMSVTNEPLDGMSALTVQPDVSTAELWIDSQYVGRKGFSLKNLAPGTYYISISASGYDDLNFYVSLKANTRTNVFAKLKRQVGYINIKVKPNKAAQNAIIGLDSRSFSPGLISTVTGQKDITIKSFGFVEKKISSIVYNNLITYIEVELIPAKFDISKFYLSKEVFNPNNYGTNGFVDIAFNVTTYGSGNISIYDDLGNVVYSKENLSFTTWKQSYNWYGTDNSGRKLADGRYTVQLTAYPLSDDSDADTKPQLHKAIVNIDSSLVIIPSGFYGGVHGSVYAPTAFAPVTSGFAISASGFASGTLARTSSPASVTGGMLFTINMTYAPFIDAGLALETLNNNDNVKLAIKGSMPRLGVFGFSGLLEGKISNAAKLNPAWLKLGTAFSLGSPFVSFTAMPHIGVYWENAYGTNLAKAIPSGRFGMGLSLNAGTYAFGSSLSVSIMTQDFRHGFVLAWPIQTAFEMHFALPKVPLQIQIFTGLDFDKEIQSILSAWQVGLGLTTYL